MSALVVDDIGMLVTCEPSLGEGPLGLVRDAALVIEDGLVASVEPAGAVASHASNAGRNSFRNRAWMSLARAWSPDCSASSQFRNVATSIRTWRSIR